MKKTSFFCDRIEFFFACFAFGKKDRRGIAAFVVLILVCFCLKICLPEGLQFCTLPSSVAMEVASSAPQPVVLQDSARRKYTPPSYMKAKRKLQFGINTADTLDFQQLPGIGSKLGSRIVTYREKLGGFTRKTQLREVWGIDSLLYLKISSYLVVDSVSIRKLSLNHADLYELKSHPYLDYYQAKEIVYYRQKYGTFQKVSDLQKVNLISPEDYELLAPYVTVE